MLPPFLPRYLHISVFVHPASHMESTSVIRRAMTNMDIIVIHSTYTLRISLSSESVASSPFCLRAAFISATSITPVGQTTPIYKSMLAKGDYHLCWCPFPGTPATDSSRARHSRRQTPRNSADRLHPCLPWTIRPALRADESIFGHHSI